MLGYVAIVVMAAASRGASVVTEGEVFTVWFRHLRGWAPESPEVAIVAVALVALGATFYDGIGATGFWADLAGGGAGWEQVPVATLGLAGIIVLTGLAWWVTSVELSRRSGRPAGVLGSELGRALFPLAGALVVVHGAGLLLFEGQTTVALLSDPLGRGWDLLGTATWVTDYEAVGPEVLAWGQVTGAVAGHVAAARVARRAVSTAAGATERRSAMAPVATVMGVSAAASVALLLG
jgi:hypothetical protein